MWRCDQRKKERTDQKSFLPLLLAAEGQQQLEKSSDHSRESRLREGSSYLRVGTDGLCYTQEELAKDQVQLGPSHLLTMKPKKKAGKILQLAVNLFAQGL